MGVLSEQGQYIELDQKQTNRPLILLFPDNARILNTLAKVMKVIPGNSFADRLANHVGAYMSFNIAFTRLSASPAICTIVAGSW